MKKRIIAGGLSIFIILLALSTVAMASDVTIIGEVNDSYQIVAQDGKVYEVADTEKGNDLVENQIGQKVKVTGTLMEEGEYTVIFVKDYEVLAE